jgi:hypothetical protein
LLSEYCNGQILGAGSLSSPDGWVHLYAFHTSILFCRYRQAGRGGGGAPAGGRGFGGGGMGGGGMGAPGGRGAGFSRQAQTKALKESVQSGHRTGLPRSILDMFAPRPMPGLGTDLKRIKPKQPLVGVSQVVEKFAEPGDLEYEPKIDRPPEPRLCRNRELPFQSRIDSETKAEK